MRTVRLMSTSDSEISVQIRLVKSSLRIRILYSVGLIGSLIGFPLQPRSRIGYSVYMEVLEHLWRHSQIFRT